MFIHLSSQDSEDMYPCNAWNDFTVELACPLYLDISEWECGLVEISFAEKKRETVPSQIRTEVLHVYCNIISSDPVGNTLKPLLRRVHMKQVARYGVSDFGHVQFVPVTQTVIQSIRVYIKNESNELLSVPDSVTRCTLQLRRK